MFTRKSDGSYTKLRKVGGAGLAQIDNPENGPSFGADSLVIPLGKEKPKLARSKLGSYYERFADGTNSLFGKGNGAVLLKDLKVYHGVYEEGEYIPFTYVCQSSDVLWSTVSLFLLVLNLVCCPPVMPNRLPCINSV